MTNFLYFQKQRKNNHFFDINHKRTINSSQGKYAQPEKDLDHKLPV